MKLVDWDKVKISYDKQVSGTVTEPIYNIKVEAPTVEAIPIEWIKHYKSISGLITYSTLNDLLRTMLNDWEKENGSNRQEQITFSLHN